MKPWEYYAITHAQHTHLNPVNPDRFGELVALLNLRDGARVVDIACGKGEPLIRIAERYRISGTGVDLSPYFIADAQAAAQSRVPAGSDLSFLIADGATYAVEPESLDLGVCLGASWVFGGHRGTLRTLAQWVRPGGLVMVGEPFWIQEPAPEYLAATQTHRDEFATHAENALAGGDEGLDLLYTIGSSPADWDRYEGLRWQAAERHAAAHPQDPDVPAILERARRGRDSYLRWGRDCLGWAVYLFRKP